jgi:tungstate transport system ATP-binding protein
LSYPIYEICSLKHTYVNRTVLFIDHLCIKKSSIIGLFGPNGSGKSTLLRILGLIEKPTEGKIFFNGYPVEPFSSKARFLVSLLPQEPFLMKRSVYNNVSYGLKLRGNVSDIPSRVKEALFTVGLSYDEYAQRPWYALSGGEMQRVALASRLTLKPQVLLLDEPTANVDAHSAQLIKETSLKARKTSGTTLIIASHDLQWLYEICDEVLHLFQGKILGSGQETFVYGPWQNMEAGKWGKYLSDGQIFYVTEPPHKDAIAVINALPITDNIVDGGEGDVDLHGTVYRLSLERISGQIFMTVLVGDLRMTMKLNPLKNNNPGWFPGKKICIRYRLEFLKWI